jgi:hypothetical protein
MKALVRLLPGIDGGEIRAPAGVFDRVRADAGDSASGAGKRAGE